MREEWRYKKQGMVSSIPEGSENGTLHFKLTPELSRKLIVKIGREGQSLNSVLLATITKVILKHKYPEEMGGVRWVPVDRNKDVVIHKDLPVKAKRYPMNMVLDPNDYSQANGECWLIDGEYIIDQDIEWLPSNFEKSFIHTFHVDGQLEHKYPEETGGIRWIPLNWETAETPSPKPAPRARSR